MSVYKCLGQGVCVYTCALIFRAGNVCILCSNGKGRECVCGVCKCLGQGKFITVFKW